MKGFKNLKLLLAVTSKKGNKKGDEKKEEESTAEQNIDIENEKSQLKEEEESREEKIDGKKEEIENEDEISFDFSKREIRKYSQKFPPKPLDKLTVLDYYSSNSPVFAVEFRPNKKRSDGEWICTHRLHPEEHWTSVKRIDVSKI